MTTAQLLWQAKKKSLAVRIKHQARQLARAALGRKTYQLPRLRLGEKTVVLVDDRIDPVRTARLTKSLGRATLLLLNRNPSLELTQKLSARCQLRMDEEQHTSRVARHEDAERLFRDLRSRGQIEVAKTPRMTLLSAFAAYRKEGGLRRPDRHVLFADLGHIRALNQLTQEQRQRLGLLGKKHITLPSGEKVHERDYVFLQRGARKYGLSCGDRAQVVAVRGFLDPKLVLQTAAGRVTVPVANVKHDLSLGYALPVFLAGAVAPRNAHFALTSALTLSQASELVYQVNPRQHLCLTTTPNLDPALARVIAPKHQPKIHAPNQQQQPLRPETVQIRVQ
jgi:hypothetical protein